MPFPSLAPPTGWNLYPKLKKRAYITLEFEAFSGLVSSMVLSLVCS